MYEMFKQTFPVFKEVFFEQEESKLNILASQIWIGLVCLSVCSW